MAIESIGSIIPQLGFLDTIVQRRILARIFHDALYPALLYRGDVVVDKWEANVGDRMVFTRSSLLSVDTDPLTPGTDPESENEDFEQWEVVAAQYGKSSEVNMAVSRTALANLFLRKAKTLGLNAGQTLNRLVRNRLYCAYTGGHSIANAGAVGVTVEVSSINGFTQQLDPNSGQLQPVSANNPKAVRINGVAVLQNVIGAAPEDPAFPFGAGTLTFDAAPTIAAGDTIDADDAAFVVRAGNAQSVDALAPTSTLTFADVRRAVTQLRNNRVQVHPDGFYHFHLSPDHENQLFSDNEFQRANETNYGDAPYQNFAVGRALGCIFYTNSESPSLDPSGTRGNVGPLQQSRPAGAAQALLGKEIYAEVRNAAGVNIERSILTGEGSVYEKYIDEMEYLSEAGVQGKVGGFSVSNNGIDIPLERIRYIIRAPQDKLQQQVSQTWSWTGDYGIPSDFFGGRSTARFKRAVVLESAQAG